MPKSPERCQEIRQEMRSKILHESMLYFAKNGFSGTKIRKVILKSLMLTNVMLLKKQNMLQNLLNFSVKL